MTSEPTAARLPFAREQDLVRGLTAHEASAWRQLFEENYERMYAYAFLRLGNTHDAEDVAASTFSEAVKAIGSFRWRGIPVSSWLYRIAHHETVDALKRRRSALALDGDEFPIADARFAVVERRHDLGTALGALKAEHREVLLLRFIDDQSVRETALALGKSEGAIKVLQMRALRAMRNKLGGGRDGV